MKRTILIVVLMLAGVISAQANEIYLDQEGDNSTINITQDGSSNSIGSQLSPSFIGGGSNNVTIDQIGSNNTLDMVVNGASTDVVVNTQGSNNIQTIHCGTTISAGCSGSYIKQDVNGSDNIVTQNLGGGANHHSEIAIVGSTNTVAHTSTNTGVTSAYITVTGDTNDIGVSQSGTTAKSVTVNSTGSGNFVRINQTN